MFDWLTQTMRLLGRLSERLSTTMHVWARFNAPGGHIDYFTEMRGHNITPMINTLVESFERLADLHTKLKSMQNQIGITQKTVSRCPYFDHQRIRKRPLTSSKAHNVYGAGEQLSERRESTI